MSTASQQLPKYELFILKFNGLPGAEQRPDHQLVFMHLLPYALLVNGVAKNGEDSEKQNSKYPDKGIKLWRKKNGSDKEKGCYHTSRSDERCGRSIFRARFLKK
ncbi:hypothetical protein Nepgr_017072 [Nepenthes gracilis]|uniref:Uncharacterized protein n=1 Tax=Nepenthes gracilis TaxID=150966 RepID=A0AAD3SRV5_NEPGR|nr:hypothetical protein Nepgr_017072 [Nepenthes gracilis]